MTDIEIFDVFRKQYGGTKRGLETEFEYFKKKHKDWKIVLPLLLPALLKQKEVRRLKSSRGDFVPYWKNLKTWIYNRCWEDEEFSPSGKAIKANDFYER